MHTLYEVIVKGAKRLRVFSCRAAAKYPNKIIYIGQKPPYKRTMPTNRLRLQWINLTFFVASPLVAISGIIWRLQTSGISGATWVLALAVAYATGLGVTAGYHRLFSHKSYEAPWIVRLLLLLFGGAAFQASARWWSSEHRYHHRYVDSDDDPYGINKGFWYAHIGWLVARRDQALGFSNIRDLEQDPLIMWQDRYYYPLALAMSFGLPAAVAALWGDPWGGLLVAGIARMVIVQHLTWCINSVAHTFGRQTYSDRHSAKDSGLMAFFTYGEGYHNFHHEFPSDYRNGVRYYQWDPAKWLIRALAWCGLSQNLRRMSTEKILQARLAMDRKRALRRLAAHPTRAFRTAEMFDKAIAQVASAQQRWMTLKTEYARVKKARLESLTTQLADLRQELRRARREFRLALAHWRALVRGPRLAVS